MISMNGFTLGFFFPKQDFARRAVKSVSPADIKDCVQEERTKQTTERSGDEDFEPSPLFLYAYRFF